MSRDCRRRALAVTLALLVGPVVALSGAELPPLREVPHPDLGGVEATVKNQLAEARARLDALVSKSGVDPRELGQSFAEMGQGYLVYDLTDAAAAALENAHRLLPDDGRWPYLLGTVYEHDRELDQAARWYEIARAADPEYLPTLLRLGDVRALQGDLAAARALYEDALKLDPDAAYTHAALGKLAARERRFADAARELERALELDPNAKSLHYPAAQAYRALGDEASMQRHLDQNGEGRVRFVDPVAEEVQRQVRGAGAELLLARMAMRDGAVDVAESRVRRAIELDPANPSAWNNLAVVMEAQGKTSEAADAYAEAARLDPDSIGRRFTLARLYQRLGRDEEAAAELRAVLELAPDFVEGRSELATILARQGRLDEAALEAREALAADPRATAPRWRLIEVLEQQGKADEARRELETLLSVAPDFAAAQFKMGGLLAAEGDAAGAIERFERAVALDPDLVEAHQNLAILYGRRGDFAAAVRHQEKAVDLGPESAEARLTLATARVLAGDTAGARRDLETALAKHPSDPRIADTLARVLATAPEDTVRDGAMAADIASKLIDAMPSTQHAETMAMALAELGRFEDAARLEEQAIAGMEEAGVTGPDLDDARRRLDLYRRGQPCAPRGSMVGRRRRGVRLGAMPRLDFLDLLQSPLDAVGLVLFLLVFPVYHGIYPRLMNLFPDRAVKTRIDLYRRSWIERLVRDQDILLAAQQTRNLTMVNTLLASSALILMGFTANLLIQGPQLSLDLPINGGQTIHPVGSVGEAPAPHRGVRLRVRVLHDRAALSRSLQRSGRRRRAPDRPLRGFGRRLPERVDQPRLVPLHHGGALPLLGVAVVPVAVRHQAVRRRDSVVGAQADRVPGLRVRGDGPPALRQRAAVRAAASDRGGGGGERASRRYRVSE